ncbi:unnamed protein product [Victoria cruziana]
MLPDLEIFTSQFLMDSHGAARFVGVVEIFSIKGLAKDAATLRYKFWMRNKVGRIGPSETSRKRYSEILVADSQA